MRNTTAMTNPKSSRNVPLCVRHRQAGCRMSQNPSPLKTTIPYTSIDILIIAAELFSHENTILCVLNC